MTVLLTIQLNFPASIGVWIVGAVVGMMALTVVLMIREPVIKKY
jgi:phosphate/sulfate permease